MLVCPISLIRWKYENTFESLIFRDEVTTMQYRTDWSRQVIKISEIGFGCGNNAVLMVKAPYEDQRKAVRHALDRGINFFDTAFAYGLGKSEENLGRILNDLGAQPVISTKIRLEADAVGDVGAATIRAVEAGLKRLNRDRVDFIQLHTRVTLERGAGKRFSLTPQDVLGPKGVVEGFKTMRDRGKVGYFGFSGLGEVTALHQLVDSGEFHGFQAYYNLLNPSAGQPVPQGFSALDYRRIIDRAAGQWNGRLCHSCFGGGRVDVGSQPRRRQQPGTPLARIRLSFGCSTCREGESCPRCRWKKSGASGDPLWFNEIGSIHSARGLF